MTAAEDARGVLFQKDLCGPVSVGKIKDSGSFFQIRSAQDRIVGIRGNKSGQPFPENIICGVEHTSSKSSLHAS